MRLLILGGSGMIGHRVWLAARDRAEAWTTVRDEATTNHQPALFDPGLVIGGVTADDPQSFDRAMDVARPDVVINAIGFIKSGPEPWDDGAAFRANSFVPHYVRSRCDALGARLIHISTDCVFNGSRGGYTEDDVPDALDSYGLSKRLGEVPAPHTTIRTSAIGRSLDESSGLVEWLLSQDGSINGWRGARFSGLTTPRLADTLVSIALEHPSLAGTWHVAAPAIDKYSLLTRLRAAYDLPLEIVAVDEPKIDRSLDDRRFREATGIPKPDWDAMIDELVTDSALYPPPRARTTGASG